MTGVEEAWAGLVESLGRAGDRLRELTAGLDPHERADGYAALIRALNNNLARFEVDPAHPELVFFNGWREKLFMDNPDFRYWVADIEGGRRYRISGTIGDAAYQSVTVYAGEAMRATATARIDSDELPVDADGRFELTLSAEPPESGPWLPLDSDATMVWVRQLHEDVAHDRLGACSIVALDPAGPPTRPDERDVARQLRRLGRSLSIVPEVFAASWAAEADTPNELRHWSEMTGGAGFTEPGIRYLRGSWQLEPGEALVVEAPVVDCRYWNILLYSRFLNSLDHRARAVSRTSGTARLRDGRYRFVIAGEDPGIDADWLDTEGRAFGLVVMRWLQPAEPVPLPDVRRVRIQDLQEERP